MAARISAIFIAPNAGDEMQGMERVLAVAGRGLEGDRYAQGQGSWNRGNTGQRQVTLVNVRFFDNSGFSYRESRRNIVTEDVELMWLIGKEFGIGDARMQGLKYCTPCERPGQLAGKKSGFRSAFHDCGGLIAAVVKTGHIWRSAPLALPSRP